MHALTLKGLPPKRQGNDWSGCCPAHDDQSPSLSLSTGSDRRVLIHCFSGCSLEDILAALNMTTADLFDEGEDADNRYWVLIRSYEYVDENGQPLYCVDRYSPKTFRQRRYDPVKKEFAGGRNCMEGVTRVPYHLDKVVAQRDQQGRVVIVEGERDADKLLELGITATTNPGGAGKWNESWAARYFKGMKAVTILPDNDATGEDHATAVAASFLAIGVPVKIVRLPGLPDKGDVSWWLAHGGTKEELREIVKNTPLVREALPPKVGIHVVRQRSDQIVPQSPDWWWPLWLPKHSLTMLIGPQGLGKSTFTSWLVAKLTTGGLFPDSDTVEMPLTCGILSLEEGSDIIVSRLQAAGADRSRVYIYGNCAGQDKEGRTVERQWRLPDDVGILGEAMAEDHLDFLIIDGVGYTMTGDSHNYSMVGSALAALKAEAETRQTTILGIVHPSKSVADVRSAANGSIAWSTVPRVNIFLGPDPADDSGKYRVAMVSKTNYRTPASGIRFSINEDPELKVGFLQEVTLTNDVELDDLAAPPPTKEQREERKDARSFLMEIYSDRQTRSFNEVMREAREYGLKDYSVRKAYEQLGGKPVRSNLKGGSRGSGRWEWPPPGRPPLIAGDIRETPKVENNDPSTSDLSRSSREEEPDLEEPSRSRESKLNDPWSERLFLQDREEDSYLSSSKSLDESYSDLRDHFREPTTSDDDWENPIW